MGQWRISLSGPITISCCELNGIISFRALSQIEYWKTKLSTTHRTKTLHRSAHIEGACNHTVHASQGLKVGLYTPTILGGNSYLCWFYDRGGGG